VQSGIVTYIANLRPGLERAGARVAVMTAHIVPPEADASAVVLSRAQLPKPLLVLVREAGRRLPLNSGAVLMALQIARSANDLRGGPGLDVLEMEESFGAARYVQRMTEVPVVVRLHGPHFLHAPVTGHAVDPVIARAERRCVAEAVGITSPARDVLDRVRREFELPLEDAVVIPNPVPVVPAERRWSLEACDKKTILFVGRFDRHKGGDIVIDAFRTVAATRPEAELVFVGPHPGLLGADGRAQSIADYLDAHVPRELRARIHVVGPLPAQRIEPLRRQAFVTVMPSRYEIFGLALAEALAFGCPTVAANVGGIPEILLADRTGLLFEGGDAAALATKILTLFDQPERAADLGRAASADMERRMSPDVVARASIAYYEALRARFPRVRRRAPVLGLLHALTRP
jgi:glycosyltransferase involved in cell wall biosynthesis